MKISVLGVTELIAYIIAPFVAYFVIILWSIFWSLYPSLNIPAIFPYIDPIGGYCMFILSVLCISIYIFIWKIKLGAIRILALVFLAILFAFAQPNVILKTSANLNILVFSLCSIVAWLDILYRKIALNQPILNFIYKKKSFKNFLINGFCLIGFPLFMTDLFLAIVKMIQTSQVYSVGGNGLSDGLNGGVLAIIAFSFVLYIPELLKKHWVSRSNQTPYPCSS